MITRRDALFGLGAAGLMTGIPKANAQIRQETRINLDLQIDVSGSIKPYNYELQFLGHATALETLANDIEDNGPIGISASVYNSSATPVLPWTLMQNAGDVLMVSGQLRKFYQERAASYSDSGSNGTRIDLSLEDSLRKHLSSPFQAWRRVTDISSNDENAATTSYDTEKKKIVTTAQSQAHANAFRQRVIRASANAALRGGIQTNALALAFTQVKDQTKPRAGCYEFMSTSVNTPEGIKFEPEDGSFPRFVEPGFTEYVAAPDDMLAFVTALRKKLVKELLIGEARPMSALPEYG